MNGTAITSLTIDGTLQKTSTGLLNVGSNANVLVNTGGTLSALVTIVLNRSDMQVLGGTLSTGGDLNFTGTSSRNFTAPLSR
jgi:hypothetical protein